MSTCEGASGPFREYAAGPYEIEASFPLNGIFSDTAHWFRDRGTATAQFAPDAVATQRLGVPTYRLTNVVEGDVLIYWEEAHCEADCSYCDSPCDDNAVHIAAPDMTAPTRPDVALRTVLVSTPDTSTLCPDLDVLEIDIAVSDDVEPLANIALVAYIAPTREEVAQMTMPTTTFGFDYRAQGARHTLTILLGESEGHVRDGENPFTSPDTFCVAFAAFDRAGNLSERSETTCLDTNDENDPTVVWVDDSIYSSGCCHTAPDAGPATALLAAAVALVLRGTGRARRPGTP